MSAAIIIRESECSICGQDPEDCEHISGRIYNGERCHRIVTRADVDHIAVVSRPNHFDARITHMSVDVDEIREKNRPRLLLRHPGVLRRVPQDLPGNVRSGPRQQLRMNDSAGRFKQQHPSGPPPRPSAR